MISAKKKLSSASEYQKASVASRPAINRTHSCSSSSGSSDSGSSAGKAVEERLSLCVRDWASSAGAKRGVDAGGISSTAGSAAALCRSLVELDRLLCWVESGSVKYGQDLFPLVSLCDVVARGVLLCCEEEAASGCGAGDAPASSAAAGGEGGGGRYDKSLVILRGHVERARQVVAPLCGKGRLGKLARRKHVRRNCEAVRDAVFKFAVQHKPELATAEDSYVSDRALGGRITWPRSFSQKVLSW